jgi:hypothetical protein
MQYLPAIVGLGALWLIAAPFLLGYAETAPAMQNDIGVGSVILLAAVFWFYQFLKGSGSGMHRST